MRNILLLGILFAIIFSGCSSISNAIKPKEKIDNEQVNLYPVNTGMMSVGYIDTTGKLVIGPKFAHGKLFKEGLAPVAQAGFAAKWGYINKNGNYVIRPQFDDAEQFSDGLAAVEKDKKWGFVDKKGNMVIQPQFKDYRSFVEDVAWAKSFETDSWGLINKSGLFITKPNISYAYDFSEGLSAVKINGMYGFIDNKGKLVIPNQYAFAYKFTEGLAYVQVGNKDTGKYGYIDKKGKMVIPANFFAATEFAEGFAGVKIDSGKDAPWGYIDKTGKLVIKPGYGWAGGFQDGMAPVAFGEPSAGSWGFIDKSGKTVIEPKFRMVSGFMDGGVCQVQLPGAMMGYIDKTGKLIFEQSKPLSPDELTKAMSSGGGMDMSMMPDVPPLFWVVAFIVLVLIYAFMISLAARYMDIQDATFGKCFLTALCAAALNMIVSVFFKNAQMNMSVGVFSWLVSAIIDIMMIKYILNTEWSQAFMVYVGMIVILILIFVAMFACCLGGACCFIPR